MPDNQLTRTLPALGLLAAALCLVGCANQTGRVSGKVSYQGKPVVIGSVVLVNEETLAPIQGAIEPDGSYHISHITYGMYKVAVHSADPGNRPISRPVPENLTKKPKETEPAIRPGADKWFAIPERYGNWRLSGLSVTVSGPSTTFDIPLVDDDGMNSD
jgi:hypothetical protein